jgi:type I restriction enzyme R subunit
MTRLSETHVEEFTLETLQSLGYHYIHGPVLSPDGDFPERSDYSQVVLLERLRASIQRLNPSIPKEAREQALKDVLRIQSPEVLANNETFHKYLTDGVPVTFRQNGNERSDYVWLLDFDNTVNNDFLVANQVTIEESHRRKRMDVVLYVNGLPLVLLELKNARDEHTSVRKAFDQIGSYKALIPSLFTYNAFCVISDGLECKAGTISSDFSRYMAWKSADGKTEASRFAPQIETLVKGMLNPAALLDLVRNFIVFERSQKEDPKTGITQVTTVKKLAAYHQYYAVNKAVASTIQASGKGGNRKGGVVWHTQGSGKSLSMVFYSGKLITAGEMQNPTIVVITDRNDLDDQLFDTFASSRQLLRQEPVQAESRDHLKRLLAVASGGIVFTTIQKFLPPDGGAAYDLLSERSNIVVIADEAHRTQYGFEAVVKKVVDKETNEVGSRIAYGFAKYLRDALPKATYIGFTGTPIENTDVNTPAVFGNYVDVYDIAQAVADHATVRIYYESRLAKVNLDEEGKALIEEFERSEELITWEDGEGEYTSASMKAKSKWARLEAIIGHPERVRNIARDIVDHFEQRQSVFEGKGMIVAMSRRIAADLYEEIVKLRPAWHSDDLTKGTIKVIMTAASSDGATMSKHHTTKGERKTLADRMKDPADPLKLVIVRDMWLTGFDAPSLHTLYIDKPMQGHNLMQAIARVNRVFHDKPGGLVVDYLGIASDLKKALAFYSDAGGKGNPAEDQEKAVAAMVEKMEIVRQMFFEQSKSQEAILAEEPTAYYEHFPGVGFNYKRFFGASPREKLSIILQAEEHILGLDKGKERFSNEVMLLSKAFALSIPKEEALAVKEEVAFFQAVKARLQKFTVGNGEGTSEDLGGVIKRIVDRAIYSDEVIDIFDAAGMKKPEISILSEEFLKEIKGMRHRNLAVELLKKILNDEIRSRSKLNLVQGRALLEMLEKSIRKYQNNLLSTAEIIQELINLAKQVKDSDKRGEDLGLKDDELAFYDALEANDSAVKVLGDETLRHIAREIAEKVKANATIDWNIKESARAKLMVLVRRTLNKYKYPPDKQERAVETVLRQAELLAEYLNR